MVCRTNLITVDVFSLMSSLETNRANAADFIFVFYSLKVTLGTQ